MDPSCNTIAGDKAYPDLASFPESVEAVVVEVPRAESEAWVEQAARAGIQDVRLHQSSHMPQAIKLASDHGLDLRHGTCAVMYVTPGLHVSFNSPLGTEGARRVLIPFGGAATPVHFDAEHAFRLT